MSKRQLQIGNSRFVNTCDKHVRGEFQLLEQNVNRWVILEWEGNIVKVTRYWQQSQSGDQKLCVHYIRPCPVNRMERKWLKLHLFAYLQSCDNPKCMWMCKKLKETKSLYLKPWFLKCQFRKNELRNSRTLFSWTK